jgi:transcription initiation factor IIF auxiliary subunit
LKSRITKNYISLTDEQKFDFILIGILCEKKDYRISMELNKKLEINLSKEDEYTVFNSKRMEDKSFSFYEYTTEEDDRFNLISNKSQKGFLLPELNQIDYLFVVRLSRMALEENEIINAIKEIPIVLGAYKLEASQLKSGENLVF